MRISVDLCDQHGKISISGQWPVRLPLERRPQPEQPPLPGFSIESYLRKWLLHPPRWIIPHSPHLNHQYVVTLDAIAHLMTSMRR